MARKGRTPRITIMKATYAKTQDVLHKDRDNTDDLETAEMMVHARKTPLQHPDRSSPGTFDSRDNVAYNGNTVVAP